MKNISVKKLSNHYQVFSNGSDFDIWGSNVTQNDVLNSIRNGIFEETPFQLFTFKNDVFEYDHAARIAFLVKNIDSTPIELDVGIPLSGYYSSHFIVDGNHRFAAALIRKDKNIMATFCGDVGYFNHLFVKKNKKYSEI